MKSVNSAAKAGLAFLAAAALLVGCTTPAAPQSTNAASSSADAIAGTVVVAQLSGTNSEWIERAAKGFEAEHPGVDIQINAQEYASLIGSAAQIYSSSNAPDVGFLQSNAAAFSTLAKAGALEDLSDVWESAGMNSATAKGVKDAWTVDGTAVGVPTFQVWAPVMFYNKDIFKKAGLADINGRVASMDEWSKIVSTLKTAGIQPLSLGAGGNSALHIVSALLQVNSTDEQWQNYLVNTNAGSTAPAEYATGPFLSALQTIARWKSEGTFASGVAGMTGTQSQALFASGGVAMISDGSWAPASLKSQNPDFEIGWFLYPSAVSQSKFQAYTGDGLVVPKTAKNPVAAKAFVQYLVSKAGQSELGNSIPIRTDMDVTALTQIPSQTQEQLAAMSTLGAVPIWSPSSTVVTAVLELVPQILTGDVSAEDGAARIQKVVDKARAASK